MKPIYEPMGAASECGDQTSATYPEILVYSGTEYKMIPLAEGYYVSRNGEVVSLRNNSRVPVLRKLVLKDGYPSFIIKVDGKNKTVMAHRAVLSAWNRLPREGECARHLNDVKTDNRLENLAWGTARENGADKVRNGRSSTGESRPTHKLTDETAMQIRERYADGEGSYDLAQEYGLSQNSVLCLIRGKTWKHLPTVPQRKKHVIKRRAPYTEEARKNMSDAVKKAMEPRKLPRFKIPCACGCGTMIDNIGMDCRKRRYAWGHNARVKKNGGV